VSPAETHENVSRLLSAYLDGELTQAESQLVRVHLEDCAECREAYEELRALTRVARELDFPEPPEERMAELERRISVRAPRRFGWIFLIAGLAALLVYALIRWISDPDFPTTADLIAGAIAVGFVLLFLSVLRQRWLELPHDRYRRIKR
jgi:anti-sigma factor RsiW